MLKKLFSIPDTFESDDHRRRQVLNVLLIVFMIMLFLGAILTQIIIYFQLDTREAAQEQTLFMGEVFGMVLFSILLLANRSPKVPGWLSGTVFIILFIAVITQFETPYELYNGRSTLIWAIPIMVGAIIFPPRFVFAISAVICVLMQVFTPLDIDNKTQVNYYSMLTLIFIAFISWLVMTIANRSIRDARHHAANLESILNRISDGVLVLDSQGNFISANPALLRMIPEDKLREMNSKPLEETTRWKRTVFSVSTSPLPGVGSVAIFRDETRRHEIERAKDALLATASHELRTPLAAVMNYLELLLMLTEMSKVNTPEFTQHLIRAIESSKRLQHLVNEILDQAQIQAGVLELKKQLFNLPALLEKTRQLLDALLIKKNLDYELIIAPGVPAEITGDPERLHQVLVNLLGNAIKFTQQGRIKVSVSLPRQETLSIEVTDTGPGIPEEQLPDIFEAFRRGSNYAQREHQGAGLGLSISKEIVNRMGGEISVSSTLGVGSAFTISLPLERAQT